VAQITHYDSACMNVMIKPGQSTRSSGKPTNATVMNNIPHLVNSVVVPIRNTFRTYTGYLLAKGLMLCCWSKAGSYSTVIVYYNEGTRPGLVRPSQRQHGDE